MLWIRRDKNYTDPTESSSLQDMLMASQIQNTEKITVNSNLRLKFLDAHYAKFAGYINKLVIFGRDEPAAQVVL